MQNNWSLKSRLMSFKYAFNGLRLMLSGNPNFIIQASIAVLVIVFGFVFNISNIEWTILLICISLVLSAEIFNSALEELSDFVSPDKNQKIARIKDLSASAVLLLSIFSAIVGIIIFIPKIL